MLAVFQRNDWALVRIDDFAHKVSTDSRTFYFAGTIDGLVQDNYTINYGVEMHDAVNDLCSCLPRFNGHYAGVSIRDGVLEFAASDIGAVEELYYTTTEKELIVSTDFFELAKARGWLNYDASEMLRFVKRGYCRKGKTTFDEVYRLPPGEILQPNTNGTTSTKSYMDRFQGAPVTFDIFKRAINYSIRSIAQNDPSFEEVVLFSGGVDSSVLLSLIRSIKDVSAITYRIIQAPAWNEPDIIRSERVARKLQVTHELVDVDLNEIHVDYLNDVTISMPFAAHLGINFKKIFEAIQNRKKRLWSGQNLDTLYYYAATEVPPVNRFLLSNAYVRMLKGVKGYQRYRPAKTAFDVSLKCFYRSTHAQRIETPNTISELVEYFNESDGYLAFRVGGERNNDQTINDEAANDIAVSEIRKRLFDDELGCFFTGRDHKVQLLAVKLFNLELVLLYSTPALVHLLRNLDLSLLDVLSTKRFMYRYARELGLNRSDFRVGTPLRRSKSAAQNWWRTFESTSFGIDLRHQSGDLATQFGLSLNTIDITPWQMELGLLWVNNVHEKLSQIGVAPRWPTFTGG